MKEFYGILSAVCDVNSDENCWDQDLVKVESDETEFEALQFLEEIGWTFDGEVSCPYCNSGVVREDIGEDDETNIVQFSKK